MVSPTNAGHEDVSTTPRRAILHQQEFGSKEIIWIRNWHHSFNYLHATPKQRSCSFGIIFNINIRPKWLIGELHKKCISFS